MVACPPIPTPAATPGSALALILPGSARAASPTPFVTSLGRAVAGTGFAWSFGDGGTSTLASPSHAYLQPGTYEVTLALVEPGGTRHELRERLVVAAVQGTTLACQALGADSWCDDPGPPPQNHLRVVLDGTAAALCPGDVLMREGELPARRVDVGASTYVARRFEAKFVDALVGFGADGQLLRSTDGGQIWQVIHRGEGEDATVQRVWVAAPDLVIAHSTTPGKPGMPGHYTISRDRGETWSTLQVTPLALAADGMLWARSGMAMLRSRDGGLSFEPVNLPAGPTDTVMIAADGTVVASQPAIDFSPLTATAISRDDGDSWQLIVPVLPPRPLADALAAPLRDTADGTRWLAWRDVRNETVLALYRSPDHGQTWVQATLPPVADASDRLRTIQSADAATLYAASALERWLSTDAGATWQAIELDGEFMPARMSRESDGILWLGMSIIPGRAHASRDDGLTWSAVLGGTPSVYEIGRPWLFADGRGWALSGAGNLYETSDMGQRWRMRRPLDAVRSDLPNGSLQFLPNGGGWLVHAGRLFRSSDFGQSWALQPLPAEISGQVIDLQFVDPNDGVLMFTHCVQLTDCSFGMQATHDAGVSWAQLAPLPAGAPYQPMMRWASVMRGVLIGGSEMNWFTTDAGTTWSRLRLSDAGGTETRLQTNAARVLFRDEFRGWMAAYDRVFRSEDGGATWRAVELPPWPGEGTPRMLDIHFAGDGRGWIRGSVTGDMIVLATTVDDGLTWARP